MSTATLNARYSSTLSADVVENPAQVNTDVAAAPGVQSLPELTKEDLPTLDDLESDMRTPDSGPPRKSFVIGDLIRKFGSLSSVFRVAGVAAMVLSMCLFLLDGMGVVNDTQRFFKMLLLTGLLSAGGFALSFLLKEQRGARSFFGLALLSVPVNFAVLGALLYSVFQIDAVSTVYPTVAHWEIASVASLGSTMLLAAVALLPVTVFGMSVMGREGRAWLSGALLFSSSMLLLPIRDTAFIAPIVAVLVFALMGVVKHCGEGIISLKTPAGRFVQALLFLPPAIMLFRSFWLYDVGSLSALVIALTVYVALRYACQRIKLEGVVCTALHVVCATTAFVAASLSVDVVSRVAGPSYEALIFSVVFGGLMFDIENRVKSIKMAKALGIFTSIVVATIILVHQQFHDDAAVFVIGLSVPIALICAGIMQQQKYKILIGGLTLATTVLLNAGGMIQFFLHAGWFGFASLGASAILVASLLERFGAVFSMRVRRWLVSM